MDEHDADLRYSVAASGARGLVQYASALGVDSTVLLARAQLSAADLAGVDGRISQGASHRLWAAASELANDTDFGLHFGERLPIEAFDVVGFLAVHSPSLGAAFERVAHYSRILHDAGRVEVENQGDDILLHPGCRGLGHDVPRHVAEFSAVSALTLSRRITGVHVVPSRVHFRHAAPARLGEHLRVFGSVPSFLEPETVLVFARSHLELPVLESNPALYGYLDAHAREVLAKVPDDDSLRARVEQAVGSALARGIPDVDAIARRLGMSTRTLQRRLTAEGDSFAQTVDRIRLRFANRYLRDERLSIAEVGYLLGFSEPSNFHRAFRRWTGQTPAAHRDAALARTVKAR